MAKFSKWLVSLIVGLAVIFIFVKYYSFIFSEKIEGIVEKVERVQLNVSLMQVQDSPGTSLNPALYSFAVAIKTKNGEIKTSSAEDRQWAVVEAGKCAEARFYPYPFWNLNKAGTYFNARLIKYFDCPRDP
ncbi:MAG: hypothetical protein LW875_10420 [Proteobacteria bacterium]|nr:hypothetical protein [Pseudomonadota bacterium]